MTFSLDGLVDLMCFFIDRTRRESYVGRRQAQRRGRPASSGEVRLVSLLVRTAELDLGESVVRRSAPQAAAQNVVLARALPLSLDPGRLLLWSSSESTNLQGVLALDAAQRAAEDELALNEADLAR